MVVVMVEAGLVRERRMEGGVGERTEGGRKRRSWQCLLLPHRPAMVTREGSILIWGGSSGRCIRILLLLQQTYARCPDGLTCRCGQLVPGTAIIHLDSCHQGEVYGCSAWHQQGFIALPLSLIHVSSSL